MGGPHQLIHECSIYRGMRPGANLAEIEEEVLDDEDDLSLGRRHVALHLRAEVVQHAVVRVGLLGGAIQ